MGMETTIRDELEQDSPTQTHRVELRVRPEICEAWTVAAQESGLTLSAWLRNAAHRALVAGPDEPPAVAQHILTPAADLELAKQLDALRLVYTGLQAFDTWDERKRIVRCAFDLLGHVHVHGKIVESFDEEPDQVEPGLQVDPHTCASCSHSEAIHTSGLKCWVLDCECIVFVPRDPREAFEKATKDADKLIERYGSKKK